MVFNRIVHGADHLGRAKMILLAAEGLNNDEIAERLDSRR